MNLVLFVKRFFDLCTGRTLPADVESRDKDFVPARRAGTEAS